jgi:lipopolysaccharide export system protein LptA
MSANRIARAVAAFTLPIVVFAALVPVRIVSAQSGDDKKQDINYSANSADMNYQAKSGKLFGNVVITQGTMTIRADRIEFKQNPDNSVSATAYGNPITFRQKREGVDEYFEGYAQRAHYDGEKSLLELFDRALLKRGQDEIRSNYISYNTKTELFKAEGRPDAAATPQDAGPGARVRGVFQPKDAETKAGGTTEKAAEKPAPLPLQRDGELKPGTSK